MKEIIGWTSAFIIVPTFGLQAYKQWQSRHEPVGASSLWFFLMALTGAAGQVIYSWMLGNWVFFVLNLCLIGTDSFGLGVAIFRRSTAGPQGEESRLGRAPT